MIARAQHLALANELAEAIDALTYAMACERPLREPETHPDVLAAWDTCVDVLAAWDALEAVRTAYRAVVRATYSVAREGR